VIKLGVFSFQTVSGAEGLEGLVAAGGPPSATAPGARLKHRTRKFAASGSLSDSSSSVKRQVCETPNHSVVRIELRDTYRLHCKRSHYFLIPRLIALIYGMEKTSQSNSQKSTFFPLCNHNST
jgi:hypothetical protein